MKHRVFIVLGLIWLNLPYLAHSQAANSTPQSSWRDQVHLAINETMAEHLQALTAHMPQQKISTNIKIAYLDPRLTLAPCKDHINVIPAKQVKIGRQHVKVECTGNKPWAINVPVDLNVLAPVVILNQGVSKGTQLSEFQLGFQEHNLANLRSGYFLRKEDVIGKQSKRSLGAQSILNNHVVLPALMIHKGDRVMIVAKKAGMSVKMPGEALNNGREGRQIRVKNTRSQRVVRGRVVAPGLVEVNF